MAVRVTSPTFIGRHHELERPVLPKEPVGSRIPFGGRVWGRGGWILRGEPSRRDNRQTPG